MSDLLLSEQPVTHNPNAPAAIKERAAAALIRYIQKLAPYLDEARLMVLEIQDVVEVHGPVSNEELTRLGVEADTVNNLGTFLINLIEFVDTPGQNRNAYRTSINVVRRVEAQL